MKSGWLFEKRKKVATKFCEKWTKKTFKIDFLSPQHDDDENRAQKPTSPERDCYWREVDLLMSQLRKIQISGHAETRKQNVSALDLEKLNYNI
jgi:hypothetical protein